MSLTYPQKQRIISYMADRGHWQNLFDDAFYKDKKRKWKSLNSPLGLHAVLKPEKLQAYVIQSSTGSAVTITRMGNQIRIDDESGRQIRLRDALLKSLKGPDGLYDPDSNVSVQALLNAEQMSPADEKVLQLTIEALGVTIHFGAQGEKTLFFEDEALQVSFDSPFVIEKQKLPPGKFLHAIAFNEAAAGEWGVDNADFMNAVKLIVARDLTIEPELRAFNEIDPERASWMMADFFEEKYDETWDGPWQWRPKLESKFGDASKMQKDWIDATDFTGYYVGLPTQFGVVKTDDGFQLVTYLDNREQIWTHGNLLQKAIENEIAPVQLLRPEMNPRILLHMLASGEVITDHRGREWACAVHDNENAPLTAHMARYFMQKNFGLTGYHFAAISHDEGSCVFAMDANMLGQIMAAHDATVELLSMIEKGSTDDDRMTVLLEQGANLRLVDPVAAAKNRTLANVMEDAGNRHLLAALQKQAGVRDLSFEAHAIS